MKKYILFAFISWLASLHIVKILGMADTYIFRISFPMKIWVITITETWFWAISLTIAALWLLSLKTNHTTNKIKNTIQIDKSALKELEKALKTSQMPIIEEGIEPMEAKE